jgi:hypothetical protein
MVSHRQGPAAKVELCAADRIDEGAQQARFVHDRLKFRLGDPPAIEDAREATHKLLVDGCILSATVTHVSERNWIPSARLGPDVIGSGGRI